MGKDLIKIGVFYDGNFFLHVSNYYSHCHAVRHRIHLPGFHQFIRREVSISRGVDISRCQITSAHFFRGRFSAVEAQERPNQLYNDRVFDDILMSMGIESHYLPLRSRGMRKKEKGIDVWFALEAYEQSITRDLDTVFLITSDNEHLPLLRKLKALGVEVFILNWDFTFEDSHGNRIVTLTSQELLNEASQTRDMERIIADGLSEGDETIMGIFSSVNSFQSASQSGDDFHEGGSGDRYGADEGYDYPSGEVGENGAEEYVGDENSHTGRIVNIIYQKGYGFISTDADNIFFYYKSVLDVDFQDLRIGDTVSYTIGYNKEEREVAENVRFVKSGDRRMESTYDEMGNIY